MHRPESPSASNTMPERIGHFYRTNRERVAGWLLRMGVAPTAVDDVVQNVFEAALTSHPGFRGQGALSTWIYGIARNAAREHKRVRARNARDLGGIPQRDNAAADPERVLSVRQAAAIAMDALGLLRSVGP